MSIAIKNGDSLYCMPIGDMFNKDLWEVRSLDFIPQQIRDLPPQEKMDISNSPSFGFMWPKLPGVELKNLWIYIEGRTLTLYAGVTGEKQGNDKYHYAKEPLSWIKREARLPAWAYEKPKTASFSGGSLVLRFVKKADGSS